MYVRKPLKNVIVESDYYSLLGIPSDSKLIFK